MYIRLIQHIYCSCCGVWLRSSGPTFVTAQTQSLSAFTSSAAGKWSWMLIGSERLWHLLPYWLSPAIDVFPLMKQELMSGLRNGPLSPCLFFFYCNIFKGCSRLSIYSFPVFQKRLVRLWTGLHTTCVVCANELDSSGHWNKFFNLASDRGERGEIRKLKPNTFCQCIILRQGKKKNCWMKTCQEILEWWFWFC